MARAESLRGECFPEISEFFLVEIGSVPHVYSLQREIIKGHQGFFIVCLKVVLFMFRQGFLKIFLCVYLSFWCSHLELVSDLMISKRCIYHLFTEAVHISTLVEPNQMSWAL